MRTEDRGQRIETCGKVARGEGLGQRVGDEERRGEVRRGEER